MKVHFLGKKSAACLALALAFVICTPVCQAVSAKSLQKQARKVESRLAKYPAGAFLHLFFRDGTDSNGKLGRLSETSFSFTNSDSNANEIHSYSDVTRIEKGKEYIGEGSKHHRHIRLF